MLAGLSDAELVRLVTEQRDHAAFELLFNSYYTHVKQHLYKRFRCSDADADDGAQYAFISLWRGTSLRGDSVMPLLCTCADNFLIQQYRRTAAHPMTSLTPVGDERPLDFPDVRESAEPELPHDALNALPLALARLDGRLRLALDLRYWKGASVAEIAAHIGLTQSTASRTISRAVKAMRGLLGVAEPRETHYLIHTESANKHRCAKYRNKLHERAYAAAASADKAMGAASRVITDTVKKPAASVGLDGKQRQGI